MPRIKTLSLPVIFIIALVIFLSIGLDKPRFLLYSSQLERTKSDNDILSQRPGEKIAYDVMLGKVRLGQAEFSSLPDVEIESRKLSLITFETRLSRFIDREYIYSDAKTFLPVRVERNIKKWFNSENIIEDYDQNRYSLTITKNNGSGQGQGQLVINSQGPIHNAALLPYYVRRIPELKVGWVFGINLPKRKFLIKLVSIDLITVPAGPFQAYHFVSEPKKFQIWISADQRRLPLKISGTGIFGYSLEMNGYSFKE